MSIIWGDLFDIYILVYLDDTLIYSAIAEDHTSYIKAVFKILAKSKFYLKYKKYVLFLLEVEFRRHCVLESGVSVLLSKVSAI